MCVAGTQFLGGMEPIFLRRSGWAPPGLPEFISEGCDFVVPEWDYSVAGHSRLGMPMGVACMPERVLRLLESLPRTLVSRQVLLFSVMLLGGAMRMRG